MHPPLLNRIADKPNERSLPHFEPIATNGQSVDRHDTVSDAAAGLSIVPTCATLRPIRYQDNANHRHKRSDVPAMGAGVLLHSVCSPAETICRRWTTNVMQIVRRATIMHVGACRNDRARQALGSRISARLLLIIQRRAS
jgi:hypothetical protein